MYIWVVVGWLYGYGEDGFVGFVLFLISFVLVGVDSFFDMYMSSVWVLYWCWILDCDIWGVDRRLI